MKCFNVLFNLIQLGQGLVRKHMFSLLICIKLNIFLAQSSKINYLHSSAPQG